MASVEAIVAEEVAQWNWSEWSTRYYECPDTCPELAKQIKQKLDASLEDTAVRVTPISETKQLKVELFGPVSRQCSYCISMRVCSTQDGAVSLCQKCNRCSEPGCTNPIAFLAEWPISVGGKLTKLTRNVCETHKDEAVLRCCAPSVAVATLTPYVYEKSR